METICRIEFSGDIRPDLRREITNALACEGIVAASAPVNTQMVPGVHFISADGPPCAVAMTQPYVIAVLMHAGAPTDRSGWSLLLGGVSDVLVWNGLANTVGQVKARFDRWRSVENLFRKYIVSDTIVGESIAWSSAVRGLIEAAHFGEAPILLLGESGTGKEVMARLVHELDPRPQKHEMIILDCSTIVPELSGSEFFGHERGAFTGALTERQGAFALADGGTLFLDEIGELSLPMQAQLLRVIQEHCYKRVGGTNWRRTKFRLICATNRDLGDMVQRGAFRADLYFRIAGFVTRLPPLRERIEDILPLAEHFIRKMNKAPRPPRLDEAVSLYLLQRSYPGNIRDLQQVIARLLSRCAEDGVISIGYIAREERPADIPAVHNWLDTDFENAIQRAVMLGAGLKEIGRAAEDCAIRYATRFENGSLQRAALRLGVTDRALQIRRAHMREIGDGRADPSRFHS